MRGDGKHGVGCEKFLILVYKSQTESKGVSLRGCFNEIDATSSTKPS